MYLTVPYAKLKELSVFGNDYDTPDGTGVRDYIHVVDLAKGHINALEKLEKEGQGLFIYNLGTGKGYSVLDIVKTFEEATGKKVPYKIAPRRAGDIDTCYSDPTKAKNSQYPSRGAIYDRNGKLLVFNQPAYDITFVPREVTELDTLDFCRTLNITKEQLLKRMKDVKNRWMNPGYSRYTHQVFMTQLSAEECGVFQEKLFKFPGFYIQRRTIRQYTYNSAGHALGDIGEVSMRDIEADDYYIRGDYVGKQGIEKSYEKYLRGEKGVEVLLRDAHGRIQGHYMDGKLDRPSIPGKNLKLGLDIDLQMLGERLMKNKIGAIVAIEPETGEILCLVSAPNFDPHLMIGRQRGKNHNMLQRDKQKPLLNRAIMGVYPPGSTFKTAQALTFLQEGSNT